MKILEEYNRIKKEHVGKITLIKSGAFYIALGIDAYILNEIIKLKLTGLSALKRVGVPINSIKKYISIMQKYDIPYVVVDNKHVVYEYNGNFDFVVKTEKIDKLIELLHIKDKIINAIFEILSKNLGEII